MKGIVARVLPLVLLVWGLVLWQACDAGLADFVAKHDFRAFYTGALMAWNGAGADLGDLDAQLAWQRRACPALAGPEQLNVFLNPPAVALVLSPLAALPMHQAFVVWSVLVAAAFAALGTFLLASVPEERRGLALALTIAFPPVLVVVVQGQFSFFLALAFLLAWRELERGRDLHAGLWLSLALVKPQLALVPALWLARTGRWRALAGLASGGAIAGILSLLVAGPTGVVRYASLLLTAADRGIASSHAEDMQSLAGLIAYVSPVRSLATKLAWAAGAGSALALLLVKPSRRLDRAWASVLLVAVFASPHLHFHDLTLLVVPATLLARDPEHGWERRAALAAFALGWVEAILIGAIGRSPPLLVLAQAPGIAWLTGLRDGATRDRGGRSGST